MRVGWSLKLLLEVEERKKPLHRAAFRVRLLPCP
jgi:hypothetical protein